MPYTDWARSSDRTSRRKVEVKTERNGCPCSSSLPEQQRLRDYAYGINPFFGLDPLIELLAQRRLLIYRKDTSKDDKLAIEVLRNSIREVLDQILAEEKKEADAIAREHEKHNILEKAAAYKQEFDKGMVEGAWSLLKFLKEVNDVVSPMMILTRAGKSAWDAAEGSLQGFAGRFSRNMNTAQYREIVEALGFDPAEIDQKTLYLAFDIATVVWEDEDTQAIITRFAKNLAAAQHSLEWANIAGGAVFEIVLTAILAALTAGAGATVALAGKGKYLRRLGELLRDLAEPLKRLKRRWGKGSRGKGAGSGKKAVVEEVEAPGYNEPPPGDRPKDVIDSDPEPEVKKKPDVPLAKLKAAREAQGRAAESHKQLPARFQKKTVASNGTKTLSGYKPNEKLPEGFTRNESMLAEGMLEHSAKVPDYTPTKTGRDPDKYPGGIAVTHAEKQLARYHEIEGIDSPIGVSREQCGDCRNWFQGQAKASGKELTVADPEFTRIYKPDGSVDIYSKENALIRSVGSAEKPSAKITGYEGNPW